MLPLPPPKATRELQERLDTALNDREAQITDVYDSAVRHGEATSPHQHDYQQQKRDGLPSHKTVLSKTFHGLGCYILRRSLEMRPDLSSRVGGLSRTFKVLGCNEKQLVKLFRPHRCPSLSFSLPCAEG
ncbi:hypothetical protein VOLCADRAFT_95123 [Volvox carteri f. nagariensis]|uniref:Uncharacterized protein n=1 Tax=Volvox carteri f. nagariensis TaxID=3068 RepID=D8U6N5_VOLCA|nr:uncharacterized protein VOLCADRAFT_95123 [Volvox carteri f. nagariensis]EFJ44746.1 hypothetical protein VOLCADRAFT_95123 [Volvox carteri f. nagariensis]|eukprot:XP_002954322.1 hypothetical protein VOLCADRAFT_95123 [Volvox carteri f. nagariensis]